MNEITSLDLYLDWPAATVHNVAELRDVGAGVYPCYYMRADGGLKVATSAAALAAASGRFEPDRQFDPPDYLALARPKSVRRVPSKVLELLGLRERRSWLPFHVSERSPDARVRKLRPFERVSPSGERVFFRPDRSLSEADALVRRSAELMTRFVQGIERRFPEHVHVIMTGGKDSQLIWLVPKLAPDRWHVFSSYPNDRIVSEWLERNDRMPAGGILRHDNQNDETRADTERKVACSDLYSDPRHIRWLPFMRSIAEEHGGRCIFWGGTMSSPAHIYKGHGVEDFSDDPDRMWRSHFERTASWQGNYHQTFFNFVGCPYLSPYHSPEIWSELFVHLDPRAIGWGSDLRDALGQALAGRPVWWSEENPGPEPYSYTFYLNGRTAYRRYVQRLTAREREWRARAGT